jgi:uncharacterized membrane-anchored protein
MARRWLPLTLVVAVQLVILALVPLRQVAARRTGTPVTLRTRPVDPYDVMSGYYVTLAYEVERPEGDESPPPGTEYDDPVYVIVAKDEPAWRFVGYAKAPIHTPDRLTLRARWQGYGAKLEGADRLYIPESRRHDVDEALGDVDRRALVDVRVADDGTIAVLRLRASGRTFGEQ